jgi:ABC-type uncharacterized transport system involved in gliding motility auxiliary subunit
MTQRIFSIIGWIGTAIVFIAVAIRILGWSGRLEIAPNQDEYIRYAAYAGLALVVIYTLSQWREILHYFRRRQARYGAIATLGVVVALALTVAVNYLGARRNKRWDLTASRQYTLSDQTIKILQSLDSPAKFTVYDQQVNFDNFRPRLNSYAYYSPQVAVEYIDPDLRPAEATKAGVQQYGTITVEYKGKLERVTANNEQDLTNALIKTTSTMERKVYYLQGHGEREPNKTERDGYSAVSGSLRNDNYMVERLVLAQMKEVPDDATVVLIPGPTTDILPTETDALKRYLARGGKLMVMLDPPIGANAAPLPNLEGILKEWGITPGRNVVVDITGATNDPSLAVAQTYPLHPITERFSTLTIYPLARSIDTVEGGTNGRVPQRIVETTRGSWAEANLASLSGDAGVSMDEASGDKPGPIALGVAVSAPVEGATAASTPTTGETQKPETRVVVFGDSDFPSNAYGGLPGNLNLFANAISWLAQQENLIAIRPTEAADRRVTLTPRSITIMSLASRFGIPAAVFIAGIFVWRRRRR